MASQVSQASVSLSGDLPVACGHATLSAPQPCPILPMDLLGRSASKQQAQTSHFLQRAPL